MATVLRLEDTVKAVLEEFGRIHPDNGKLRHQLIFDDVRRSYALFTIGRDEKGMRVHYCVVHIDVVGDTIVLLRDQMLPSIKDSLYAAGVPASAIVHGPLATPEPSREVATQTR